MVVRWIVPPQNLLKNHYLELFYYQIETQERRMRFPKRLEIGQMKKSAAKMQIHSKHESK